MFYLNTRAPFELYEKISHNDVFVDKTEIIELVSHQIGKEKCYLCITKPRRFGKSVNATMLGAFYSKGTPSTALFSDKIIAAHESCMVHQNQYNVIYISFNEMPDECNCYQDYINNIRENLKEDIYEAYPDLIQKRFTNMNRLLQQTGDQFIFIFDEWDSIFYKDFMKKEDKESYLRFLEGLLKGQPYVKLAYMTGVLPIAKYSSGSALNMFDEFSFISDPKFDIYFGFTEKEVHKLCEKNEKPTYEEIAYWYDGYYTNDGQRLFNPRSVSNAFSDGLCRNYWTETGPMNEIADCIEYNIDAVREDIVQLTSGIPVKIKLNGYSATDQSLTDRNEILSAMVVFGFLSYHKQMVQIPNHELMEKYNRVLSRKSMGKVAEVVTRSRQVLEATLRGKSELVAMALEEIHDMEIPLLKYNDENSLSCVVTLAYLYARDFYHMEREAKSGKGYCDYLFIPFDKADPAIILELKYGTSAEEAIQQIKDKNYMQKVAQYKEVILVGINYDKKESKRHECIIEKIRQDC